MAHIAEGLLAANRNVESVARRSGDVDAVAHRRHDRLARGLKLEGRLVAQEHKGRYTYRLPQSGEEAEGSAADRLRPPCAWLLFCVLSG